MISTCASARIFLGMENLNSHPLGNAARHKFVLEETRQYKVGQRRMRQRGMRPQVDDASYIVHRPHEASSGSFAFSSDPQLQGFIVGMHLEQVHRHALKQHCQKSTCYLVPSD